MKTIHAPAELRPRRADSHKGDYGRVLVLAGSRGMVGAAALAGNAALRSGAGLVTIGTPQSAYPILAAKVDLLHHAPLPGDGRRNAERPRARGDPPFRRIVRRRRARSRPWPPSEHDAAGPLPDAASGEADDPRRGRAERAGGGRGRCSSARRRRASSRRIRAKWARLAGLTTAEVQKSRRLVASPLRARVPRRSSRSRDTAAW